MKNYKCKRRSPCAGCTRVPDPKECENKRCLPWRQWFTERWNALCRELTEKGGKV